MNTYDLKIFLEVAKNNSFSVAADELYMAQSSVSKAVKRLEDELDVKLFIRKHSSIELTLSGKELYSSLNNLIPEFNKMIKRVKTVADNRPVEVAYMIPMMKFNLPELFNRFTLLYPDIHVSLEQYTSIEEAADNLQFYPPITLMYARDKFKHLYDYSSLCEDQLVAVISKQSTLSKWTCLSIENLKNETILTTTMSSKQFIMELFSEIGAVPKLLEINSGPRREIALRKVTYGHGIAIMYKSDLEMFRTESLQICAIKELPRTPLVLGILKDYKLSVQEQTIVNYLTASDRDPIYTNVL